MSYYYKPSMGYSVHALQRARERLNLKDKADWEVKESIKNHIHNSTKTFRINGMLYLSASNTNIFFVINESSNTLVTVTLVSAEKQLRLMGGW
ncbi:hypothetical protein CK556_01525 [Mesoplasma chauliocola]|uniref:DUF4258 domain-containing protein n=1 Tax=Mesoplasma chauliocola TaxID=216427 RepID=A0A249SN08_9MOLU|nr:hypothetical protein [Mesoplasma chauliocola]ASZ09036.1 hypothetical protein CK556_01525 [Mesoplasma chauliocola]